MVTWVVTLLIGAVMIWLPERYAWSGFNRFVQFLLIVLILQLALLHIRLYTKAFRRYVTTFTQTVAIVTIALVVGLAVLLVLPAHDRRVGRLPRPLLALRRRRHDPRRRRHRPHPARERAVRAEEGRVRRASLRRRGSRRCSPGRRTPTA